MKATIENGVVYSPYPKHDIPVCSIYTLVKNFLRVVESKLAVVDYSTSYTRLELLKALQRYAAEFQTHGITIGHRVCVHLKNSVENFVAVFGIVFTGATVILAKTSLTERELHYQMSDGGATHVLTDPQNAQKVMNVSSELQLQALLMMGDAPGFVSISGNFDERTFKEVVIKDPMNSVAGLSYTSGTTGLPKGVEITHRSFVANMILGRALTASDETDVFLAWNPITHMSGFLFTMLGACIGSTCIIVTPALTYNQFMDICNKYQVTSLFSFPSRLQSLVLEMKRTGTTLEKVRKVCVGGSALTEALAQKTLEVFPNLTAFRNLYGLTESCGMICSSPPGEINWNNLGFPSSCAEVKILDLVTKKRLGPYEQGELVFRTPSIMRGYHKRPKDTFEILEPSGWCYSGDLAFYDKDGRFHFVERMKEMIKCMDNQVVPAELEDLILKNHPGVVEVAIAGLPHPEYGEAAAAFIILSEQYKGNVKEDDIKKIVSDASAKHKQLFCGVFFVDSLPHTETGKVQKSVLQKDPSYRQTK